MSSYEALYSGPANGIDFGLVRQFVLDAEVADLFSESVTFEAKERRNGNNVAEAVAALSNTDGGIVLVGVKDKGAVGEARLVGVPPREHDQLVSHLHNLIPTAMPKVHPVRIPDTDRLLIVLRVDADAVAHPVLVAGRVLYRVPGQTVPADRQRVLDLVARDTVYNTKTGDLGGLNVPASPWDPINMALFPESTSNDLSNVDYGTLRVTGGLVLPHRIIDRPWLDSRARQAAVDVLNSSPWRSGPYWHLQTWEIREARATTVDLYAKSAAISGPTYVAVETGAHLNLAGRSLSLLVALRWSRVRDGTLSVPLEVFYWALLGSLVTIASTCRHVASALDAAEPSDLLPWEGWLQSSTNRALDVVDIGKFVRDNRDKPAGGSFPAARTNTAQLADLDQLARNWLTYWLLEIGTRNFETWLGGLQMPDWLRSPELGLPI
jgi:hypothetical protein